MMIVKPGRLSKDYIQGIRQRYMKPIPMFFVGNLIYFLFPLFETFNTSFHSQMRLQDYSDYIRPIAAEKMRKENLTEVQLADLYNAKTGPLSKLMLILFVPAYALVFGVLHMRKGHFFADHLTLGLEFMSYILFYNTIVLSFLMAGIGAIVQFFGGDVTWLTNEWTLLMPVIIVSIMYFLIRAERTFYGEKWVWAVVKAVLFFGVLPFILVGYRLLLFFATMRSIHGK
jgi:hypothetical protein